MSKHTPGPWETFSEPGSQDVAICSRGHVVAQLGDEVENANAVLIASAPELLEACEAISALAKTCESCDGTGEDGDDSDDACRACSGVGEVVEAQCELKILRAAIARARGGQ